MMYRMEEKGAVKRSKKVGNAHVFEPVLPPSVVHGRFVRDLLDIFGGSAGMLMSHLVESGNLTLADVREVERRLEEMEKEKNA
jgi:predicted transcriptional regulator